MSMGDAGEGLVDAESRLAERMEEREQEKKKARLAGKGGGDPERIRQLESLRLAQTEMRRQLDIATHPVRKQQLVQAIAELDKRLKQLEK